MVAKLPGTLIVVAACAAGGVAAPTETGTTKDASASARTMMRRASDMRTPPQPRDLRRVQHFSHDSGKSCNSAESLTQRALNTAAARDHPDGSGGGGLRRVRGSSRRA